MLGAFREILYFVRPYKWRAFLGILASAIDGALPAVVAYLLGDLLEPLLKKGAHARQEMMEICILLLGVFFIKGIFFFASTYLTEYTVQRSLVDLRKAVYSKLQGLSLSFFEDQATGQLMSRLTNDIHTIQRGLTDSVNQIIKAPVTIIFAFGFMLHISPKLTVASIVLVPLMGSLIALAGGRMRKLGRRIQQVLGQMTSFMQEAISSIRIVQIFCRENYEVDRFHRENMTNFRDLMRAARLKGVLTPAIELIGAVAMAFALWLGFLEVIAGRLEAKSILSFIFLARELGTKFADLGKFNITIQHAEAASERIVQVLQTSEDISDEPDAEQLPGPAAGRLTFDHVFFKYKSSEQWVIEDFCLEVAPGQIVALVGPSGAGKTTIANLVPRLYEATKGRLSVDGYDVTQVTLPSLRSQMGIVPQETLLFSGSVKDNIAYGKLDATDEEVFEAAHNANAVEFIEKLPQQFDTQVGERGVSLSGGQRQRIAIARALLLNPRILILDEATSLLDSESERLVQQALEKLMKGRTTLVIAHRLSTVRNANIICVMERGRLAEKGSHDELIAQRGLYYSLHQIQSAMGDTSQA